MPEKAKHQPKASEYTKCPDCGCKEVTHCRAFTMLRKPQYYDAVYCETCGWAYSHVVGHTRMPVGGYG